MEKEIEIWKDIPGLNGEYQISSLGRFKSIKRYRIGKGNKPFSLPESLKVLKKSRIGVMTIRIGFNGVTTFFDIGLLVAKTFIPNPTNSHRIEYLNSNFSDNRVSNLKWILLNGVEQWVDIKGYEGLYQISNTGKVYSYVLKAIRKTCLNRDGYFYVSLSKNRKGSSKKIHKLVASHFIENKDSKPHIDHIDGNKLNNHASNLRWCTHAENIKYGWETGAYNNLGSKHGMSKLSEIEVKEIKRLITLGERNVYIAPLFNVNHSTICDIRKGRTWKHL